MNGRKIIFIILGIIALAFSLPLHAENAKIIISYWSWNEKTSYPIPGSYDANGNIVHNQDMQDKLDYLNIIDYAFLRVKADGTAYFNDSTIDLSSNDAAFCQEHKSICEDAPGSYQPKYGNFSAFAKLQNKSGTLKKLISIGGANNTQSFNNAITQTSTFVESIAAIINYYHLDGIDLDFEPESFSSEQARGYANLVTALRQKLGPNVLIIVTIAPDQNITREFWQPLAGNASYIADMCYDFHAPSFQPYYTGYNSNLYSDSNEPMMNHYFHISCDQSLKLLTFLGVPPEKIILGYPSFGLVYGGVEKDNHGLFQLYDPNKKPTFEGVMPEEKNVPYSTILNLLKSGGFREFTTYDNGHISGVWAYNSDTKEFIAYDNAALIKEKVSYVNSNHLAGLMTWLLINDAPISSNDSLLKAANQK